MKSVWRGETLPVPGDELGRERARSNDFTGTQQERKNLPKGLNCCSYANATPENQSVFVFENQRLKYFEKKIALTHDFSLLEILSAQNSNPFS